jgi:Glycosyl hydrolase family 9
VVKPPSARACVRRCRFLLVVSFLTSILAILAMWLVYPKNYSYTQAMADSYGFYESQRIGKLPADYPISWRGDSLLYERGPGGSDLTGGYITGGAAGAQPSVCPTD